MLLENHWELLEVFFLNLNREQKQIITKQDKPCIPIPHCKLTVLRKHLMGIFMVHFIFTLHCYELPSSFLCGMHSGRIQKLLSKVRGTHSPTFNTSTKRRSIFGRLIQNIALLCTRHTHTLTHHCTH